MTPQLTQKVGEFRAALDKWLVDTKDLGAVPETELIKRGLVEDRLSEYSQRKTTGELSPRKKKRRKRASQ